MNFLKVGTDEKGHPVEICYNDYGTGKPVLLVHGWPLSKEMWEYQVNDLVNAGFRVITYDRRGFGKSSQPWNGYDYSTLTNDLKEIIDQLKLTDITLVGFSMGGGEVVRYFSKHGGINVSKVVLISAVTPYMLQTDTNPHGVPQEVFDEKAHAFTNDRLAFLEEFVEKFFGVSLLNKPLSEPLLEYYRMLCSFASPRASTECTKSYASTDFRDEMNKINVPTLIIHGDADKNVPIDASAKESLKLIPNSQLIIYEDAPHGLFYNERERLNADLIHFINSQPIVVPKLSKEIGSIFI